MDFVIWKISGMEATAAHGNRICNRSSRMPCFLPAHYKSIMGKTVASHLLLNEGGWVPLMFRMWVQRKLQESKATVADIMNTDICTAVALNQTLPLLISKAQYAMNRTAVSCRRKNLLLRLLHWTLGWSQMPAENFCLYCHWIYSKYRQNGFLWQ